MKRYLWILLLAACSAPTGEVTKTVKTNENAKTVESAKETEVKTPETEVKPIEKPEKKVKEVKQETLEGTYFGIRKLNETEFEIKDDNEDDGVNDRRLALEFNKDGKAGWGDADDENTAKNAAKNKQYTYEVNGDTVTVKKNDGTNLLVLELRDNKKFIYITEDNTNKISPLKANVTYRETGLVLNGKEVQGGRGPGLENRVDPAIPPFRKNKI